MDTHPPVPAPLVPPPGGATVGSRPVELIAAGEAALAAGDPEQARLHLLEAAALGVDDGLIARLAGALTVANRYLNRHQETLQWIEGLLAAPHPPAVHAVLLAVRIHALLLLSTQAALDLAEEALAAADGAGDEVSYAGVLADAAFAAYRRGDPSAANRYAALAASRTFRAPAAMIDARRATLFSLIAAGESEKALAVSIELRAYRLLLGDLAGAAVECAYLAEDLLELGRPAQARAEACRSAELAAQAGHRAQERSARILVAMATAEEGDLDAAITLLRQTGVDFASVVLGADAAAALSYWLVERNAPGDAREALGIAQDAVARAESGGVAHRVTMLLAILARAYLRLGDTAAATDALARARRAADAADASAENHLALTVAEVMPEGDAARAVALASTRARILRVASRRESPRAFCTAVRLNRRLLELSGGVPQDLPK